MYYIWRISHLLPSFLAENLQHFSPWHTFLVAGSLSLVPFHRWAGGLSFYRGFCTLAWTRGSLCRWVQLRHGPGGQWLHSHYHRALWGKLSPCPKGRADTQGLMPKRPGGGWEDSPAGRNPESRAQPGRVGLLSNAVVLELS